MSSPDLDSVFINSGRIGQGVRLTPLVNGRLAVEIASGMVSTRITVAACDLRAALDAIAAAGAVA